MDLCPNCNKKQYYPSTKKCNYCGHQISKTGIEKIVPKGYILDDYGNIRSSNEYMLKNGKLSVKYHYLMEEGKTTLRGSHPKLHENAECEFLDRLDCNYGNGYIRCENMKYSENGWYCLYSNKRTH